MAMVWIILGIVLVMVGAGALDAQAGSFIACDVNGIANIQSFARRVLAGPATFDDLNQQIRRLTLTVLEAGLAGDGLAIIDISDPTNPIPVHAGWTERPTVSGGFVRHFGAECNAAFQCMGIVTDVGPAGTFQGPLSFNISNCGPAQDP